MNPNPPPLPGQNESSPLPPAGCSRRGWWVFLGVLLAPALLTLATAQAKDAWPFFTFFGSIAAGLFCGFWLSWRTCRTTFGRIFGGLALALLLTGVAFGLCCAGCAIGGVTLNIH